MSLSSLFSQKEGKKEIPLSLHPVVHETWHTAKLSTLRQLPYVEVVGHISDAHFYPFAHQFAHLLLYNEISEKPDIYKYTN